MDRNPQPVGGTSPDGLAIGPVAQILLLVRDVERAVGFYRDVLGLPHLFTAGDLAFFDVHGMRLYLHAVAEQDWRPGSVLYLSVDDIEQAYGALQARGVGTTGAPHRVHSSAYGVEEWVAFFDDGEGNTLGLLGLVRPPASAS